MVSTDPAPALGWSAIATALLVLQLPAVLVLLARLAAGPFRRPPLAPQRATVGELGSVSVVVPTLNERDRLSPCLAGLSAQGYEVREILVVDSHSTDGTDGLVKQTQTQDPRFRLIYDDPLPADWVGRPWALHTGFLNSSPDSRWVLGIDADTQPQPGLIAALVQAAEAEGWDLISLAPQFILKTPGELLLQPSLLITLVYRFGPAGSSAASPERVMANGQCFLCRRELLSQLGGYRAARQSFCDDVTLARYAAQRGAKVDFWDGSRLLKVRMYEGLADTWREWGRSLDLKDAAQPAQVAWDLWFLVAVQAAPWLLFPLAMGSADPTLPIALLSWLNGGLLLIRLGLQGAIASSYDLSSAPYGWLFWLAPLTDIAAVVRIALSSLQRPTQWRGRQYPQ
ncbi:glycosyl transferase [filamentous cyanobacterium CCP5]|nr:glycosyl transferase [filamentous cyanobacterium CCP5]